MIDPVEHGGEEDKAEEGDGEFIIACGDAAMAFEASEEVFDGIAMTIKLGAVVVGGASACSRRNTGEGTAGSEIAAKVVGIKAAIGQDPASAQVLLQRGAGPQVVLRAGRQTEPNIRVDPVHDCGQLCIESALGFTLGLAGLTSRWIGSITMHFDVRTIDAANPPPHLPAQLRVEPRPHTRGAPPTKTRVNQTPRTEQRRQVPSRRSGAQHIPDRREPYCQIALLRPLTLIFLAEPTAAPAAFNMSSSASDTLRLALFVMVPRFEETP